jgi:histidinol-phosphate aminotransferase
MPADHPATGKLLLERTKSGSVAPTMRNANPPYLTPLAARLPATVPFTGPEALERRSGQAFRVRLGANESAFGPSPGVIAALAAAAGEAWMYGDPELYMLRAALARHHGVTAAEIVPGSGIDGLLGQIVRLTLPDGGLAVMPEGGYPTFAYHVTGYGGEILRVPYRDDRVDLDAMVAAARASGARLLYLANPDNPMGTWHQGTDIAALLAQLPEQTLLVLDEAYADLAPAGALPDLTPGDPRVIRLRTFSKAHGLAGLRVGYAIGAPGMIAAFERVRDHFGMGRLAPAAALAALADPDHLARVVALTAAGRARISHMAEGLGLCPLASATNFVTVDMGADGAFARRVLAALLARGVFVRMPQVAPLDRCIRFGVGTPEGLDILEETLPAALAEARQR